MTLSRFKKFTLCFNIHFDEWFFWYFIFQSCIHQWTSSKHNKHAQTIKYLPDLHDLITKNCLSRNNTKFVPLLWAPMHHIVAIIISTVFQLVSTLRLRACMNIHRGIERHCTVCNFSRIVHVLVSPRDTPQEAYATALGCPGALQGENTHWTQSWSARLSSQPKLKTYCGVPW